MLMSILRETSADRWLRQAWEEKRFIPLVSDHTESELIRTLRRPRFELNEGQVGSISRLYLSCCETVRIPDPPPETPPCRDRNDQHFLTLAYQADADYLVTRDEDLRILKDTSRIPIIRTPDLFAVLYNTRP